MNGSKNQPKLLSAGLWGLVSCYGTMEHDIFSATGLLSLSLSALSTCVLDNKIAFKSRASNLLLFGPVIYFKKNKKIKI
jgi:hypothetical protein